MKVRDAVSGSWAKPWTAACAAAKVEMVFIVRSFVKSEMEMERGSFGGLAVTVATVLCIKLARGGLNDGYFKSDKRDVELVFFVTHHCRQPRWGYRVLSWLLQKRRRQRKGWRSHWGCAVDRVFQWFFERRLLRGNLLLRRRELHSGRCWDLHRG
jgi:hypothetical protein